MKPHDMPPDPLPPELIAFQRHLGAIRLDAAPADRDRLLWRCGEAAGRAAVTGIPAPRPGSSLTSRLGSWLPLATATAAAFVVGFASGGTFSAAGPRAADSPRVVASPSRAGDPAARPAQRPTAAPVPSAAPRRPPEGLHASVPINRIDEFLAIPHLPSPPPGYTPPPNRPALRVGSARSTLEAFDL